MIDFRNIFLYIQYYYTYNIIIPTMLLESYKPIGDENIYIGAFTGKGSGLYNLDSGENFSVSTFFIKQQATARLQQATR